MNVNIIQYINNNDSKFRYHVIQMVMRYGISKVIKEDC
jgi:hypothetical protein